MAPRRMAALVAALSLSACGAPATDKEAGDGLSVAAVSGPQKWGAADNVMQLEHVHVSGQPDAEGFAEARANGIGVVIDARLPGEVDWDERAAVEAAGMSYYNVPISREGDSLDRGSLREITAIVERNRDEQILVHCRSGNRVSAWLATHLVEDHGLETDEAIGIAREMGLTSEPLEERVRRYLDEAQP